MRRFLSLRIQTFHNLLFSFAEILAAFRNATQCATKWAKAWHTWALFNTAVMSHYTMRGFPNVTSQFVVAAVTGYFHSIACAANSKGVDDSLQVKSFSGYGGWLEYQNLSN